MYPSACCAGVSLVDKGLTPIEEPTEKQELSDDLRGFPTVQLGFTSARTTALAPFFKAQRPLPSRDLEVRKIQGAIWTDYVLRWPLDLDKAKIHKPVAFFK